MIRPEHASEVAASIAERLARSAIWRGAACTWPVSQPDYDAPFGIRRAKHQLAGPFVYSGTAGISLFLLEAFRLTESDDVLRAALGALEHARTAYGGAADFAFQAGPIGIAFAHARFAERLGDSRFLETANQILRPLAGHESQDRGFDVLSGAGGSIPILLQLANYTTDVDLVAMAVALGENLLQRADRSARGWSWKTLAGSAHNLTGYAHGVAGIAHALAELYAATGLGKYRYAVEQAVAYERSWFETTRGNWPDFRHNQLSEVSMHLSRMSAEERREAIKSLHPYRPSFMSAWCHGASGIGLSRLRLFELLGDQSYAAEAEAALQTTRDSLRWWRQSSFSLCHGVSSDCEFLLAAGRVLGDHGSRDLALTIASQAAEAFEEAGVPWRSGATGAAPDPSLMLGDAGIGYFYSRIAAEDVPSLILPSSAHSLRGRPPEFESIRPVRDDYVVKHFGQILGVLNKLGSAAFGIQTATRANGPEPELSCVYAAIERWIDAQDDSSARRLRDAFAFERIRYEMLLNARPRCDLVIKALAADPKGLDADDTVALAADVRILTPEWDWDAWLASGNRSLADVPRLHADSERTFAFWPTSDGLRVERLEHLARVILRCIEEAGTTSPNALRDVVAEVLAVDTNDDKARSVLRTAVMQQLAHLHRAGLLEKISPNAVDSLAAAVLVNNPAS